VRRVARLPRPAVRCPLFWVAAPAVGTVHTYTLGLQGMLLAQYYSPNPGSPSNIACLMQFLDRCSVERWGDLSSREIWSTNSYSTVYCTFIIFWCSSMTLRSPRWQLGAMNKNGTRGASKWGNCPPTFNPPEHLLCLASRSLGHNQSLGSFHVISTIYTIFTVHHSSPAH
jgi:hypothetical protein